MEIGLTYTSTLTVENKHLAIQAGSGDLEVLATPVMMALMENAAMLAVKEALDEGMTTVGGHISSSHLKPTALGKTITATAVLTGIEGRKLTFKVIAEDETGTIALPIWNHRRRRTSSLYSRPQEIHGQIARIRQTFRTIQTDETHISL